MGPPARAIANADDAIEEFVEDQNVVSRTNTMLGP